MDSKEILEKAYVAFNKRTISEVLSLMHKNVRWPNRWEGGYVNGHDELRDYWTRQWQQINPTVTPVSIKELPDGRFEVLVQQVVKDLNDATLVDTVVKHIYTIEDGLISEMEVETE